MSIEFVREERCRKGKAVQNIFSRARTGGLALLTNPCDNVISYPATDGRFFE
jgi:hypothetical protein